MPNNRQDKGTKPKGTKKTVCKTERRKNVMKKAHKRNTSNMNKKLESESMGKVRIGRTKRN